MSVSLIPGELKAHQPDGFMGRIRALGTEQKAEKQNAVSAVPSHGRKKTGISLSGVKGGALLFIQQTCAMHLSKGPQCPLGNNSGKGEYHEASAQVIQVPGCACVSLGGQKENGIRTEA